MTGADQDNVSGVDRRTSLRASSRFSGTHDYGRSNDDDYVPRNVNNTISDDDDDDDDYALAAMGISDGFRPAIAAQNHGPISAVSPEREFSPTRIPSPPIQPFHSPRPSSITKKENRPRESLTLRHDGDNPTMARTVDNDAPANRISVSETPLPNSPAAEEARDESLPGPSHPYGMYSQNVRAARTASMATTSTAPISERSYHGPQGPTHPYGMYPQTMVPEVEEEEHAQSAIPVGFPGAVDNYQRRLGPEGEEAADMIGPDGHMEQLPPYTRYPEEAYQRKALGIPTPQPGPAQNIGSLPPATQPVPGAGGIGLATRDPEFASTDDLAVANSPLSRQSVRSFASETSHHEINTAALSVVNEKEPPKGWRAAARKRVWGVVPCWAIVLAILVLILMGVVVGAVLGTILGTKLREDDSKSSSGVSFNSDFEQITDFPPGLPALAQGTYDMPLMLQRSPDTCFDDTTQAGAWNCNILYADLSLTVSPRPGEPATSNYSFTFSYNDAKTLDKGVYSYGMQPPSTSNPLRLRLVQDSLEPDRGPAWSFQTLYNKTVIIPEEYLSADQADPLDKKRFVSRSKKQRGDFMFGGDIHRKGVAQPGEKPWICYWESTLLETFIYATQNNSFERVYSASATATSSAAIATETGSRATQESVIEKVTHQPKRRSHQIGDDNEENEVNEVDAYGRQKKGLPPPPPPPTPTQSTAPSSSSSASGPDKSGYFDGEPKPSGKYQVYPRVIKVMERRIPGFASVDPWCRQFEILDDGNVRPVTDKNGNEIHVRIKETEEELEKEYKSTGSSSSEYMSDCGCLWWLT